MVPGAVLWLSAQVPPSTNPVPGMGMGLFSQSQTSAIGERHLTKGLFLHRPGAQKPFM